MIIRVTESEIRKMITESVNKILSLREGFGGFDEEYLGGFDEGSSETQDSGNDNPSDRDGDGKSENSDMQRKRSFVLDKFSNKMGDGSDVKRRGAIDLLYHPKDDAERDTYRSEFSKYLNPEDKAHVWDDSQINKLYNWLSDLL
jgi:hypothetical protein